ncbi:hypothetical protein [Burkholderia sp. AW49-1]
MWSKLMTEALKEQVMAKRFTFHDLRAYYVTRYKAERCIAGSACESGGDCTRLRLDENRKAQRHVMPNLGITKQKRHCLFEQCRF